MKFTLLGTGTSQGIPVIGCNCPACLSIDERDKRLRCSALLHDANNSVVIDVGPDFRTQALNNNLQHLDAVLITHEHNDHLIGLDDLRPLIFKKREPMKIYAEKRVLGEIRERFRYAFEPQQYPGAPSFELIDLKPGDILHFGDIRVETIRSIHGQLPILGFIVQDKLAYLTDINGLPEDSMTKLADIELLILDALREKPHHSHNSLQDAINLAGSVRASKTFLIHLSHVMGPTVEWEKILPKGIYPSYDGLTFELD